MMRRGPVPPTLILFPCMIAGVCLAIGEVIFIMGTLGESHPIIGVLGALWIGPASTMLPSALACWAWEKKHPGCFDEVDALDALMECAET